MQGTQSKKAPLGRIYMRLFFLLTPVKAVPVSGLDRLEDEREGARVCACVSGRVRCVWRASL